MSKNKEMTLVPRLRFPEFKRSADWVKTPIVCFAKLYKGKGISKADLSANGKTPCIRYGELYTTYGEIIDNVFSRTDLPDSDLVFSEGNEVLIPSSGETQEDIAKASCVLHSGVALGGDLNIIKSEQDGRFLSYFINGPFKNKIAKVAQGNAVVHLYISQLEKLVFPLADSAEQKKIADCLSSLDELIAAQREKVEVLKNYKKGLLQQLFPKKGEAIPRLRFPEFKGQDNWAFIFGDQLFESVTNKNHKGELPILAITQEHGAIPRDMIDYNVTAMEKSILSYKIVEIGDFIISLRSFQGGVEYSNYRGICSPAYIVLRKKSNFNSHFFRYYFKSERFIIDLNKDLEGIRDGKMVSYDQFSKIALPFPIQREQQKIAEYLISLDELISELTSALENYRQHKKGLLQNLFPSYVEEEDV